MEGFLGAHSVIETVDTPNQELHKKPNGAHDSACCWTGKLHVCLFSVSVFLLFRLKYICL